MWFAKKKTTKKQKKLKLSIENYFSFVIKFMARCCEINRVMCL